MKRWTGLLLCFLLITFFVVATSESQIVQSIEAAGTLFEDGTPIPVFRVTLTLRDLTKNTSVLITPKGKTKDTMRFISKDLVGTSVDEDMKLLDPEGNEANSFPILGDQSIRIMVLDDLSEGTFSFFEAPKTKAVYQTLLEESTASTVLNMLQVNGTDCAEATLNIEAPKLSLNLLTGEATLTNGSLSTFSYEISYNETAEMRNLGNSFRMICALENQIPDYASVTTEPSGIQWTAENNTLRFEVPDQEMVRIRFSAVPDFAGTGEIRTTVYAGALRDGIWKKGIKYLSSVDDKAVYADILTVDAADHGKRVSGAEFVITRDGMPVSLSGQARQVRTDENGSTRLRGATDPLTGESSWSLDKDTAYALQEVKTPVGYLPLGKTVPVRIGNSVNAAQGLYRSRDTVLIPYREGVIWETEAAYALNGREMQEKEVRLFSLIPLGAAAKDENVLLPSNLTAQVTQGHFSFGSVAFLREGTYQFEIQQEDLSSQGIRHQADRVVAEVEIGRNAETNLLEMYPVTVRAEKDGVSSVLTGLNLTDEYLASGEYVVSGRITLDGAIPGSESLYAVMSQNGEEIDRAYCDSDGHFSFRPISFLSSMTDRSFSIEITPGLLTDQQIGQGLKKPDTKVVLNLSTQDDGQGHMTVQSDYEEEIHFDYLRERNLSIRFREHHKPAVFSDRQYRLTLTVEGEEATPAVQSGADGQWEISGKTGNGTTLYTVQVSDGDVINLRDLPAGTGYRIAFENVDERVMTGFTWNRQSYITASMEGTIGNTLPEYEALVIYPDGIYVPHTELVCLSETVPDPLPDFALIPANERTEKAVSEGWIEIPEGMQGKAELSEDGTGTVCFSDESGQECGIRVHCMGEYQFRIVPLQDERSRFSVQKDSGLLRLRADCNGSDVLRFTDECPKIAIYGMETLDLSVEGLVTEEEFRLVASFVHERVQLDDETVRLTRNGAEETLTLEEGTALLNVKSGDRLSLLLPSGTAYFLEPVTDEAGSLELTGTDAATGQLNGPTACRLIVCRKEASLDLTVRRITEAADNGEIRFSFFEGDAEEETGTVSDIRVLRNGTPVSLTDGTVSVSDGDVLSVSGRLAGMRCRVTALDADSLITQMSTDGAAFRECSEIWMTFRSDTPERVSVVQTEAAVEIPGILELSGGALKKDMFEVVIEGADQEQETIRCPEAEDGRSTFKSRKRFLTSLGTVQWKVTSGYLGQNPTVVGDASAFIVRISAEQGEAGTVIMSRRIFLQLPDGGETKTEAIRFTGICLFPVRVSVESADSEKILPCRIVVTEAGAIDRFSYTAGTRSGTIRSGESLLLCNEEATIWLPYKAQYQVCPQLPSGYVLENEEETILTGCVGPDSAGIRLLCRYKPAVQLEGQSGYRIPVQVKFQGEEWTEEQFGFTLVPAEDETNSAGDRGFRFSDGSEALHYVADAEQPEFDVTVVADGTGEEKGIQVLRGGEYRFYLKQTDMTDEGIRYDESVAELILEVTDDGEGHLVPSFRPAENELPVFINTAQTTLYVTCEVNCQEGQSYGIEDAQRKKLPVHVRIDGLSASTVSVLSVKRGADEQIPVREESIELLLSHGETVCLTGLPTGGTYSVETGNDLSGYRAQTEAKTGNLDYHSENRVVFPFTYAPSGSVTVKGKISLLYRKAQTGEKARFVMIPADDFTRDRFEVGYRLETEVSLGKLQAGRIREQMAKNTFSVSMAAPATFFSFDPLVFSEPGIYTFELSQISGNMVDTVYDDSVYLVRITVTDPEPGSGVLQAEYVILKGGAETELSFANAYAASGEAEIKGTFSLEGRRASADEFSFLLLDEEGNQIAGCRNQADGKIAFPALMYDASDIGTVRYYRIRQSPGELGGITYDEREFRAIVAIRDEGDGVLSTSVAYLTKTGEGQWTPSDEVHFANQYKAEGALTISGEVRMLGRPFLLGESFEVQLTQEMDEDEWAEMETIVLNPEDGNRIPFSFDEIEYRLDDAEAGPLRYKVSLTANGENVRVEGDEERIFRIDITDNGDGTLNLSSSLDGELSFALMGLTEKTLCCEFDDDNNASGLRPESLTVRLLANGKEAEKIRLSEENGWQTSTGALPMADEKENDIRYELEPERARLYGLTLSWEDPDTASLVARYRPHFGSNDNLLVRLLAPATGDSGSVIGYFLALAVSGIVVAVIIRRGKKD